MIKTFYFNDLCTCCYVIYDRSGECAIVDPGCYKQSEKERLVKFINENHLTPKMIIQTHGHFDHVMGNAFVTSQWHIPTYLHHADLPQIKRSETYGSYFGYEFENPSDQVTDMKQDDIISFGQTELRVLTSPGHTPGGVLLYNEKEGYLMTGDTLFKESIGRTDLPGGDYDELMKSIRTKIIPLPHDTVIYPGHGPSTELSVELSNNPFIA